MTTKLYELPRNSYFFFEKEQYLLSYLDDMYCYCTDARGNTRRFRSDLSIEPLNLEHLTNV